MSNAGAPLPPPTTALHAPQVRSAYGASSSYSTAQFLNPRSPIEIPVPRKAPRHQIVFRFEGLPLALLLHATSELLERHAILLLVPRALFAELRELASGGQQSDFTQGSVG